jgi:hypothetical protein
MSQKSWFSCHRTSPRCGSADRFARSSYERGSLLIPGYIVKCFDPETRLHCDINVNEQLGYKNTRLLEAYCDMKPDLRPLVGILKIWANELGFNDPTGARGPKSFSSYALTLMAIGFLQVCLRPSYFGIRLQADVAYIC